MQGGMKNYDFRPISRFISEMIQDRAIVTIECEFVSVSEVSKGTILNDLERCREIFNDTKHRTVSMRQLNFLSALAVQRTFS